MLWILLSVAFGARFTNQFVEFEMPAQWSCNLEGAEWVCQSNDPAKKRDAIIILAAKLRGDQDSIDQYLSHVKQVKSYTNIQGVPIKSQPKYAKTIEIQSHGWVDSLHLDSEIPNFYTRYLATIKNDIGVLVTYSIQKNKYAQYVNDFESMVKTLKVFRKTGGLNAAPSGANLFQTAQIPKELSATSVFPDAVVREEAKKPASRSDDDLMIWIIGAVVIGGLLLLIARRRRS